MSKLDFKLTYKDALILKHALEEQCDEKIFNLKNDEYLSLKGCNIDNLDKKRKDLKEEQECLKRFINQLEVNKSIKGIE